MKIYPSIFEKITLTENLFSALEDFQRGKTKRADVIEYGRYAERNIFRLQHDLISGKYTHGKYTSFFIYDPKLRHIRKACVRDRIVHQVLYTILMQIYEPKFINAVYSSRIGKGTHKAVKDFRCMTYKVSRNFARECWGLKCDIKRFYDSVDHEILFSILQKTISDEKALILLKNIIDSFHVEGTPGKGAPIGNLTSQIFTNIYLNEFDQFIKQTLKVKHYLRFADDMLFLSHRIDELHALLPKIEEFLCNHLKLRLHPDKIILRPLSQGIDFLGYVTLPQHRVLRTATKKRMLRNLSRRHDQFFKGEVTDESLNQAMQSYLGILSHADAYGFCEDLKNIFSWRA